MISSSVVSSARSLSRQSNKVPQYAYVSFTVDMRRLAIGFLVLCSDQHFSLVSERRNELLMWTQGQRRREDERMKLRSLSREDYRAEARKTAFYSLRKPHLNQSLVISYRNASYETAENPSISFLFRSSR